MVVVVLHFGRTYERPAVLSCPVASRSSEHLHHSSCPVRPQQIRPRPYLCHRLLCDDSLWWEEDARVLGRGLPGGRVNLV